MICRYPKVHKAHWVQKDTYDLEGRKWCAGRVIEAGPYETLSRKKLIRLLEKHERESLRPGGES